MGDLFKKIEMNSVYPPHPANNPHFKLFDPNESENITKMGKESMEKFLSMVSKEKSGWYEDAKWRQENRDWLNISTKIAIAILQHMREQEINKETMAERIGCTPELLDKIVKGSENMTLETLVKIQKVIPNKILAL